MATSKDMKFIKINKQEDVPEDTFFRGRLSCATNLEELVLPNGDVIVSNKDLQEDSSVPLNVEASILYSIQTGSRDTQIRGHCYLIKLNIKYWPKRPTFNRIKQTLRYAHLAPTSLIAAVDVINKINGNGNIDTAYHLGTNDGRRGKAITPRGTYREGDKAEATKLINKEAINIIEGRLPV